MNQFDPLNLAPALEFSQPPVEPRTVGIEEMEVEVEVEMEVEPRTASCSHLLYRINKHLLVSLPIWTLYCTFC
jgi:hypothetical protein